MRSTNRWALTATSAGEIGVAPGRRLVRPVAGAAIAAMLVAIGVPLAATSASAAVITPGALISVFPATDLVTAEGYAPGSSHTVNVLRGGFTVGTSQAVADGAGAMMVNHPATTGTANCFNPVTPDIRAGDVIQVLTGTTVDSTTTAGVTVTQQATFAGGTVTVKGTAATAAGGQIPIAELEARVNARNTKFVKNDRPSLRAPGDGILAYDTPTGNTWTATFAGMSAVNPTEPDGLSDGARAVQSESRGMWIGGVSEVTIFEKGPLPGSIVGGPTAPCTAPAATGPTMPAMTAATDTGASATDLITSNLSPTFVGAASLPDATGVNLYVDGAFSGRDTTLVGGEYSIVPNEALAQGMHSITVGEVGPSTVVELRGNAPASIFVDTTVPGVTLGLPLPPNNSADSTPTFTFSGDEAGATFQCQLLPSITAFAPCASPHTFAAQTDGVHTFNVQAIDLAGNVGNPASFTWNVDTTAPVVLLASLPSKITTDATPTFTFTSSPGTTFECQLLPSITAFAPCTSPKTFAAQPDAAYTFKVRATDASGNVGVPAQVALRIATRMSDFNGDGLTDLVARDKTGKMWLYPGSGSGAFRTRVSMGSGWGVFNKIVSPGDLTGDGDADILARNAAGQLWLLSANADRLIGSSGWNAMTAITAAGDMTGDAQPDVLARDSAGRLWLYPTAISATKGAIFKTRILVGASGWNAMNAIMGAGDLSGDGRADLLARDSAGKLWLYRGTGTGRFSTRTPAGTGWKGMTALVTPGNWDHTGGNDLIARDGAGKLWLYPGNNAGKLTPRRQIGTGFNGYTIA